LRLESIKERLTVCMKGKDPKALEEKRSPLPKQGGGLGSITRHVRNLKESAKTSSSGSPKTSSPQNAVLTRSIVYSSQTTKSNSSGPKTNLSSMQKTRGIFKETKGDQKKTKSQEDKKKRRIFGPQKQSQRSVEPCLVSSFNSNGNKASLITHTSEYYQGIGGTRLSFLSSRESINDHLKDKEEAKKEEKEKENKRYQEAREKKPVNQAYLTMTNALKKMKEDLGRIKYEIKKRQYNSLETVHFLANLQSRPICGSCEPSRLPISGSVLSQREDFSSYRQLNPKNEEGPRSYKSKPPRQAKEKGTLKVSIRKQPLAHRRGSSSLADCFQSNLLQAAY
jgi:hypothetical protein